MRAVEQTLVRPDDRFLDDTPVAALSLLALGWLAALVALPPTAARVVGLGAAHGALLGTALAWTAAPRPERWAPLQAAVLIGTAALCARAFPAGAFAYLAVPVWLGWRRRAWLGAAGGRCGRAIITGGMFGAILGLHLLVNASLALGYRLRPAPLAELVGWMAYDIGANVLATEAFFRLALFRRAYRRWPFVVAVVVSASASVVRYLLDPLLPHSVAIVAGATFYLLLLGAGNCVLLLRTGSLLAPLSAGIVFFGAYRLLTLR